MRSACRRVRLGAEVSALLIIPSGLVVGPGRGIESGIQPVLGQLESFLHDERGVRVIDQILFRIPVVFDRVAYQAAQEGDVGARANLQKKVRGGGRTGKS